MNHEQAMQNQYAERYLLCELTNQERESYEEHFFDCAICARDVNSGAEFMHHARALLQDESLSETSKTSLPASQPGTGWRVVLGPILSPSFGSTLAFAVALVIFGGLSIYQNVVTIPELKKPQLLVAAPLMLIEARDAGQLEARLAAGQPLRIAFNVPAGVFRSYDVSVQSASGEKIFSSTLPPEDAGRQIQLLFPAGTVPAGKYEAVIQGINGEAKENARKNELARYTFVVLSREQKQ